MVFGISCLLDWNCLLSNGWSRFCVKCSLAFGCSSFKWLLQNLKNRSTLAARHIRPVRMILQAFVSPLSLAHDMSPELAGEASAWAKHGKAACHDLERGVEYGGRDGVGIKTGDDFVPRSASLRSRTSSRTRANFISAPSAKGPSGCYRYRAQSNQADESLTRCRTCKILFIANLILLEFPRKFSLRFFRN